MFWYAGRSGGLEVFWGCYITFRGQSGGQSDEINIVQIRKFKHRSIFFNWGSLIFYRNCSVGRILVLGGKKSRNFIGGICPDALETLGAGILLIIFMKQIIDYYPDEYEH